MSDVRTVLVVGTDDAAIATLASVLRTLGATVRVARDVLATDAPDVVVVHGAAGPRRVELVHFDEVVRRPYRAVDLLERVRRLLRGTSGSYRAVDAVRDRGTG